MSSTPIEVFLPVLFIILFIVLLFSIYALNNLEIGARLCNGLSSICCCWHRKHRSKRLKQRVNQPFYSNANFRHCTCGAGMHHPCASNKNVEFNTYYEGPTNGFYRIGSRMNYYSQHFSHFHPPPLTMNVNNMKMNAIYKSSEDGSSFALPTTQLTASTPPPLPSAQAQPNIVHSNTMFRSYSSNLSNQQSMSNQPQQHTVSSSNNKMNSNKVVYFNNINWWPSKIMSEHELRKFINYNYYFDANNVNNVSNIASFRQPVVDNTNNTTGDNHYHQNLNNLVHLRQNFSDLGLMVKSQQHLMVKQQTTKASGFNAARLRKKVFSTSSNLFSIGCSNYRLSSTTEYNYSSLKNHSSPYKTNSKSSESLLLGKDRHRKYDSEPVKLGQARSFKSHNRNNRQNYMKSFGKLRKFSVSMNSLFDKATVNFAHIIKVSSSKRSSIITYNPVAQHRCNHRRYSRILVDTGVQTTSSLFLSNSNAGQDNKVLSEISDSNTNSSYNSHATQLIQTNPYGSIVANYGSASVMQRSQTARLLEREKTNKLLRLRTYSDYNVLSLSASPSDGSTKKAKMSASASSSPTSAGNGSTLSSPSHKPPPYPSSVSASKFIHLNLQI